MSSLFPTSFNLRGPNGQDFEIGGDRLTLIAGPCAIESLEHSLVIAEKLREIAEAEDVNLIFKASYDKDGRSSPNSFGGVGLEEGLKILGHVKQVIGVPVTSDFSNREEASEISQILDLVQVPAYLCRQTGILKAAAQTGRPIHVKKGQFMSPENLKNTAKKLHVFGAKHLVMTDRGTFLGYGDLVNDFRSQLIMSDFAVPGYDATHSIQRPTTSGEISQGGRRFIPSLTRAGVAAGAKVLFMEVHDDPAKALGDPGTVLDLKHVQNVVHQAAKLHSYIIEMSEELELNPSIQ